MVANTWWQTFFDAEYLRIWGGFPDGDRAEREVAGVWELLGLAPGARVLDAPCGYGRLTYGFVARGAEVIGVDQSGDLLREAEARRGDVPVERLGFFRHDLREPLPAEWGRFDAAVNLFSSLGYGTYEDDLAIITNLAGALSTGGKLFIDTAHRDAVSALRGRGLTQNSFRLPDGTLVFEEPDFDVLTGRVETTWYWEGPGGSGQKSASMRIYTATELAEMCRLAGLNVVGAFKGCTAEPYKADGVGMAARLGLLAEQLF